MKLMARSLWLPERAGALAEPALALAVEGVKRGGVSAGNAPSKVVMINIIYIISM